MYSAIERVMQGNIPGQLFRDEKEGVRMTPITGSVGWELTKKAGGRLKIWEDLEEKKKEEKEAKKQKKMEKKSNKKKKGKVADRIDGAEEEKEEQPQPKRAKQANKANTTQVKMTDSSSQQSEERSNEIKPPPQDRTSDAAPPRGRTSEIAILPPSSSSPVQRVRQLLPGLFEKASPECFICSKATGGDTLMCSVIECHLRYHKACITRAKKRRSVSWQCWRHKCHMCAEPSVFACSMCPMAFCGDCAFPRIILFPGKPDFAKIGFCTDCAQKVQKTHNVSSYMIS